MPDFSKGKIYKLVSNLTTDIYIGSCLVDLSKRLSGHKNASNPCVSKKMFENNAIVTIVLIELYPCENKNLLKARELHYITTMICINKNKPFICDIQIVDGDAREWQKQYSIDIDNVAHKKEYKRQYDINNVEHIRQYALDNKERIKENKHNWYQTNSINLNEINKQYRIDNAIHIKEQKKQYAIENAVHIKARKKIYNTNNAERIKEYNKQYKLKQKLLLQPTNMTTTNILN